MRDRILASYLKDFVEENGIEDLEEYEAFEHFVNYCIVAKPVFDSSLVPFQSNRRTEPSVTPLELTF